MTEIQKPHDRRRLRARLTDGALATRRREAVAALPQLATAIDQVQSDKAGAQARFRALCEATGEPAMPAVHPVVSQKAGTYRLWAPVILVVEVALATYTATLSIEGGWFLHLVAGFMATALFCGLGKLLVASQVDEGRLLESADRLERQLRRLTMATGLLLGGFFFSRFFPFAELIFAVVSTLLSFAVAYLVGLCHTMAQLLSAPNREVKRYTRLALLETELTGLHDLAQAVLREEEAEPHDLASCGSQCRRMGLAVGLLLLLLAPMQVDAGEARLSIWVDTSGSLATSELDRMRELLGDPLPLLDSIGAREIALTVFWSEASALLGASGVWRVPDPPPLPQACTKKSSVFRATRQAQEQACAAARAEAADLRGQTAGQSLLSFRTALAGIDISTDRRQTCLYPVLNRIAASTGFHLVLTDGAHANCGEVPSEPVVVSGAVSAAVILIPDNEGEGLAARMQARAALLRRLYTGRLVVLPSWQVESPGTLTGLWGGRTDGHTAVGGQ